MKFQWGLGLKKVFLFLIGNCGPEGGQSCWSHWRNMSGYACRQVMLTFSQLLEEQNGLQLALLTWLSPTVVSELANPSRPWSRPGQR